MWGSSTRKLTANSRRLVGISFFGYINLRELSNSKAIIVEEYLRYYLTHSRGDNCLYTFLNGIIPKVNIMAGLELEIACNDVAVQHVSPYDIGTPLPWLL